MDHVQQPVMASMSQAVDRWFIQRSADQAWSEQLSIRIWGRNDVNNLQIYSNLLQAMFLDDLQPVATSDLKIHAR